MITTGNQPGFQAANLFDGCRGVLECSKHGVNDRVIQLNQTLKFTTLEAFNCISIFVTFSPSCFVNENVWADGGNSVQERWQSPLPKLLNFRAPRAFDFMLDAFTLKSFQQGRWQT